MKTNKKTLIMMLCMFLLTGFTLVGTTATQPLTEQTQADNEAQQRVLPQDMHTSRWSVRKPRKDEQKKALWRKARCNKSRDLKDLHRVTRPSARNNSPGTAQQRAAWKKFSLKTPFLRAKEASETIMQNCVEGTDSVQRVLNREVEEILKYDTKRIKDPTSKWSYLLHVLNNMGGAMKGTFNIYLKGNPERNAIEMANTLTVAHIVNALEANRDLLKEQGHNLRIKPHTYKGHKAITFSLWSQLYQNGNTATKRAVAEQVEKDFDSNTYDSIREKFTPEALAAEAETKLQEWVGLLSTGQVKEAMKVIPDGLLTIVNSFRDKGNQLHMLTEREVATDEDYEALEALEVQFAKAYAAEKSTKMPNRDIVLKQHVEKAITKKLREIKETFHSWDISITRTNRKNEKEVTLLWHLSHMSEYKAQGKAFTKNNHTGARYLLGPSNYIRMPDNVRNGFVSGLDPKVGMSSRQYTGDAVSMQLIQAHGNANRFTVEKDDPNKKVKDVMNRRQRNIELYTMINVGLGRDPNQPEHLVMGLYTNPKLVESNGQMAAPVLKTIKAKSVKTNSKPKKRKSKKPGPNTVKNRRKAGPSEQRLSLNERLSQKHWIEQKSESFASKTVAELKDLLRAANLRVGGKKKDLVERLVADFTANYNADEEYNEWLIKEYKGSGDADQTLGADALDELLESGKASNVDTSKEPSAPKRKKKDKKRKLPAPSRGRKTGKKSD